MVEAVLDFPVVAVEGEEFRRAGPLRPQGRDAEDGLRLGPPGAHDMPFARDAEGLASARQGGQFVGGAVQREGASAPGLDPGEPERPAKRHPAQPPP